MLEMNLQLFAHKKGVGSTKNGRDSEAKRPATIHCTQRLTVLSVSQDWARTASSARLSLLRQHLKQLNKLYFIRALCNFTHCIFVRA